MGCISHANLCPASGDTENVLLQKILQAINEGGGVAGVSGLSVNGGPFQTGQVSITTGGGGGVTSVNGDAGPAVLLDTDDVPEGSTNLYFDQGAADARYVLKAGDDMTGQLRQVAGSAGTPSFSFTGDPNTGIYSSIADRVQFATGGVQTFSIRSGAVGSTTDTAYFFLGTAESVRLYRDSSGVLGIRSGLSAQTLRVYETFTSTSDFSRLSFSPLSVAGNFRIFTEGDGAGPLRILQVGSGPADGTDVAGVNSIFNAGPNTGAGTPGSILLQTGTAGASSATVSALTTRLTVAHDTLTSTVPLAITDAVADRTSLLINGYSVTGAGAATGINFSGTWNTTGAPTGLLLNILDTASAAASLLFDYQLSSTSLFNLRKDGRLVLAGRASFTTTSGVGHRLTNSDAGTTNAPIGLVIGHVTSGTPAASFGVTLDFNLDTDGAEDQLAARWITGWTDATQATRSAITTFTSAVSGVFETQMVLGNGQIQGNPGTVTMPAFTNRNNPDTGIYFPVGDVSVGVSTNGVLRFTVADTLATLTTPLQLSDSTALGANPTNAASQQSVLGEWQYRTSAANEGAGQMNRVHNRSEQVVGAGTGYALTTSFARVDFGTTDPEIVLPTAGTYLVIAQVFYGGTVELDSVQFKLRNSTDSVDIGTIYALQSLEVSGTAHAVVTVTASKTIQIFAANFNGARGTIIAFGTSISYVRLS